MSPSLKEFIISMRGHPAFPELLREVEKPRINSFRLSEAEHIEKARSKWIYESGKTAQHNLWLAMLTGQPSEQENP